MIDVIGKRPDISKDTLPLSNLSFDHPLSSIELSTLVNILAESNNISQIYFKDEIDIDSVEKVKYLLEAMPTIDDSLIEKYIIKELSVSEKEQLMNMNFLNIDTWNIAYSKNGNCNLITSLARYRRIEEWFSNVLENVTDIKISPMEKVCYIYDRVKMFDYNSSDDYQKLPEIILFNRANSYGYNLVFKELLSKLGIPAIIGKLSFNGEESYTTLALIKDDKYNADGVYVFDSSSDTISKDQYKNNWARRLNYNFFALTLDKLSDMNSDIKKFGMLKILSAASVDDFNQQLKLYERRYSKDDIKQVENIFGMSMDKLYFQSKNTPSLMPADISKIVSNRLDINPVSVIEKDVFMVMIHDNYHARNDELFRKKLKKFN